MENIFLRTEFGSLVHMRRLPSTLTVWSAGLNELKVVPFLFFAGAWGLHLSILIDFHFGECLIQKIFKLIPFQLIQRLRRKWLIFCLFTNFICHLGKHQKKVSLNLFTKIFEWNSNIIESFRSNLNYWCNTIEIVKMNWLFSIILILSNIKKMRNKFHEHQKLSNY